MNQQHLEEFSYNDEIVKKFLLASLIFGAVAFLGGLLAALQMAYWPANFNLEWISFGRLRPLHTNAAIFAFAGNAVFAGIYHSTQRLLKTRLFSDVLSNIHFWGWQLIILSAAITLPLGFSHGKEYAELEWPIDLAITVIWVVFAVNFFGTIWKRREKHLYVAIWFYIATIVTVAVLHIVNSIEIPITLWKSVPVYAGIQDALVQWWYGHNAVAFFLTTPFLGLMYYYLPKAANRPVYSYRLSIIHFWSLVFLYIWAGPHHLLYTSLPDWAQTLGMVFSVMLWAPSWGGMINGLLTLRGAWHLLRTEPVIKFFVVAITAYGMSTFEGPMMSIKSVSAISHYTDWIIGHVHAGALGWNGFMVFGMCYFLIPKLWNTEMYSKRLISIHFYTGTIGIVLYYTSMVAAGITQALMLKGIDAQGHLMYPDFVETLVQVYPLYWARALAGLFFLGGFILMLVNVFKTIQLAPASRAAQIMKAAPLSAQKEHEANGHRKLEGLSAVFTVLVLIAILVGSVVEIYPTLSLHKFLPEKITMRPYSALELAGRDVYIREGCYVCHSQQIRPIASEVLRYGPASTIEESMYDHPFQWGSKRTGPDLARVGKKYPDMWHFQHMMNPRAINQQSIMPNYPWLFDKNVDFMRLRKELSVMKMLGVPYSDEDVANADINAQKDAKVLADGLVAQGAPEGLEKKEIIALISYLQALGQMKPAEAK